MPVSKKKTKNQVPVEDIPRLFKNVKDVTPRTVKFSGNIPPWLRGTLFYNGLGTIDLEEGSVRHYLDAYSMVAKFEINCDSVTFSSKHIQSTAYKKALEAKKPVMAEFGTPPGVDKSKGFFSKLMLAYTLDDMTDNPVNKLSVIGSKMYALGDGPFYHEIDPSNLNTLKTLNASKTLDLAGFSADIHEDQNGDLYLLGSYLSPTVHYSIKRIPVEKKIKTLEEKLETVISIPGRWKFGPTSLRATFSVTENYLIFIEFPLVLNVLKLAATHVKGYSISDWFQWLPHDGTRFYIVHKASGKLIKTEIFAEEAFISHHILNAYEEGDKIIFDLISCPDAIGPIDAWYNNVLRSSTPKDCFIPGEIHRYVIPIIEDIKKCPQETSLLHNPTQKSNNLASTTSKAEAKRVGDKLIVSPAKVLETNNYFDLGSINSDFAGKKYSYAYAFPTAASIMKKVPTSYSLTKVDLDTGKVLRWAGKQGQVPLTPKFMPNPNCPNEEDNGLIVTIVKNHFSTEEKDFLIVIDAKTMIEVGRAEFGLDYDVPVLIHPLFIPKSEN